MTVKYDKIILGAGLYGLYSALHCAERGENILVLEYDESPFMRATYINQARVHMGYHYPRSLSTAKKSAGYFKRFNEEYDFCIHSKFDQVYATSSAFSWTDAKEFIKFCKNAGIRCDEISKSKYFKEGMCDGAFLTEEYAYDAQILKQYFIDKLGGYKNVQILFNSRISSIQRDASVYCIQTNLGEFSSPFVLNATFAALNQIHAMLGFEPFKIKYELCEIILCEVADNLKNVGLTVMDGPFFSIMPFGKGGLHSLTSVTFTPHAASFEDTPVFDCQEHSGGYCSKTRLGNCNSCPSKPASAWPFMSALARKYMKPEYQFRYASSLFSMKPILRASEIADSRPTVIRVYSKAPTFISVLSGKINTVYDLDEVLDHEY